MTKLFISYSHEDEDFVDKIALDLELATEGLDISIDKRLLKAGGSLTTIFKEIGQSDFLVPILSQSSITSNWCQKELRVAIVKEIECPPFKVIPVIRSGVAWKELENAMPQDLREALRDKYFADFGSKPYDEAFQELVNALEPEESPRDIYSYIADPEGENPFRRVRAEHFKDPKTFAKLFAEPEVAYDALVSPKPAFIEGGRGSGKTMILKSLRGSIAPLIKGCTNFQEARLPYFGVYFRATRDTFALSSDEATGELREQASIGIFYDELVLRLSQSVVEELCSCIRSKTLGIDTRRERQLSKEILESLRLNAVEDIVDLETVNGILSEQICLIVDYVRARSRGESVTYNVKSLNKENLIQLCRRIREDISELQACHFCFLVDEYENLKDFQKTVLNTLVKWHHVEYFTFKIAAKKTGFSTAQTLENQELEEGHDYSVIELDFELDDRYERYLKEICANLLNLEGFSKKRIESILEDRSSFTKRLSKTCNGLREGEIRSEVIDILSKRGTRWSNLSETQRQRALGHFSLAAEYRILGPKKRSFGGFQDLQLLSSGIVRVFLELCGMAYYFARKDDVNVKKGEKIEIEHQTRAAYYLSEYYLWRINKNVEYLGPTLYNFTVDIGDVFRQKLLKHLSEPEAARLTIYNPQKLANLKVAISNETAIIKFSLKKILDVAVLHSIFQEYERRGGRRGKRVSAAQPHEYVLNRIFAPVFQISPRPRWPTSIFPEDILGLLNAEKRTSTKTKLINKVTKEVQDRTLFEFSNGMGQDNA